MSETPQKPTPSVNTLRLRYTKAGYSTHIFYSKYGMIYVHLDREAMKFKVLNAVSNAVLREGESKNLNVLLKKAKNALQEVLEIKMKKAEVPVRQGKRVGGVYKKGKK